MASVTERTMRTLFDRSFEVLRGLLPAWLRDERAWVIGLLVVGILARMVAPGSVPNGFNNDEASLGYDAYSILNLGVDHHGIAYPAFLIGWGRA
jgi:hypothetical protein